MLEHDIRETYRRMAGADMPPSRISIPAAGRAGRARQRRRRAGLIAAPVFAAAAVVAVAIASLAVGGAPKPSAPAGPKAAPAHFSPTRPYGWITGLPYRGGDSDIFITRVNEWVIYEPSASSGVNFSVYAAGQCHVQAQKLLCAKLQPSGAVATYPLGRRIGTLSGFPAYWLPGSTSVTWQYARGGWAQLSFSRNNRTAGVAPTLQLARSARFGTQAGPPVVYPVQFRSVPADWQVSTVEGRIWDGRLLAAQHFGITPGPVDLPVLGVGPRHGTDFSLLLGARQRGTNRTAYTCPSRSGTTTTINGVRVRLSDYTRGVAHSLCAPEDDGLHFTLGVLVNPDIGVADLFAHHMRLLGPDPAAWTTRPVG